MEKKQHFNEHFAKQTKWEEGKKPTKLNAKFFMKQVFCFVLFRKHTRRRQESNATNFA